MSVPPPARVWSPSRAQTLLLRFLLAEPDAGRAAWQEWIAGIDLDHLDPASLAVLPSAAARLQQLGIAHPALEKLRGVHRHHWYRNHLLSGAAQPALQALQSAGVRPVLAGGAAVLPRFHRDLGARRLAAVDLLVGTDAVRSAAVHLDRAEWRAIGRDAEPLADAVLWSSARLAFRDPNGFEIALRWRLFDWRFAPGPDAAAWPAMPQRVEDATLTILDPTHLLLLTCADDLRTGEAPAVRAFDAAALVRSGDIDWNRLVTEAERSAVGWLVARLLGWLSANGDLSLPSDVLARLSSRPPSRTDRAYESSVTATGRAPAPYRIVRHLTRCVTRQHPWWDALGYLQQLHGLPRRRDALGRLVWRRRPP